MIDIDTSDPKEQRNFGLLMAGAVTVIGLVRWGLHWRTTEEMPDLPYPFFIIGIVFFSIAMIAPSALKPLFVVWIRFALVLNWIMTHILLSFSFFLTVLPIAILLRLFGNDPLNRKLDKNATSYWQNIEHQSDDPQRYTKQF